MKKVAFIILVALTLLSCNTEKTAPELFNEQQSGVCVVLNSFYYEIHVPGCPTWYCSGLDDEGNFANFTINKDEILQNKAMVTGTAFFIDKEGVLLTNRHVVSPTIPLKDIEHTAANLLSSLRAYFDNLREQYAQQYQSWETQKEECYSYYDGDYYVDQDRLAQIEARQQELSNTFDEASNTIERINSINSRDIEVKSISAIGIAYNNSFVTSVADFLEKNPCVVTKVSQDEEVDLATIQLKDKTTPPDKFVFTIHHLDSEEKGLMDKVADWLGQSEDNRITVGKPLVMIGFNAGLILGNTKQGIQAQMTTGQITQKPDGTKFLYSIPALQGSSGSPVIDLHGVVRAVNFAKLSGTDSFNFGIPEEKIVKFLQ